MENQQLTKPHLTIGTIGHANHGKTVLTAALLKTQANSNMATAISYADLAEDGKVIDAMKINITASKNVEYSSLKRRYMHIDCRGLTQYTKNMYTGMNLMDAAILVVDVFRGIEIQTREHIILARQAGIKQLVVYLNKCDLEDNADVIDDVEYDIRELLTQHNFEGDSVPVIKGAALPALQGEAKWQASINQLLTALDNIKEPQRDINAPFLMGVTNIFSTPNGTTVAGKIQRGSIKIGDTVSIIGVTATTNTTITRITTLNKSPHQGQAGDIVSCLLRVIRMDDVNRNQVLAQPGSEDAHTKFEAEISVLTQEDGGQKGRFFFGYRPQFYIGTTDFTGAVELPEGVEEANPGDQIKNITINLIAPAFLEEGMRFVMSGANLTVGIGVITKIVK